MQWLKQSTAIKPIVGPFVADTDGVTPVTFLSTDADAFCILKQGSTVMFALDSNALTVTSDATAFAELGLGTTDVDTLGMLTFVAQDADLCLPVMARFMVVEAGAYGAQITGTDAAFLSASDIQAELVTYDAIKGTEGAWASDISALNNITAAAVADAVWDEVTTDHVGAGSFGLNLDAQVSTIPSTTIASSDIQAELVTYDAATGTELAALNDIASSDVQAELVTYGASTHAASDVVANVAASDIWDTKSSDFVVAGTFGKFIDTEISGISASIAATDIADIVDGVWDEATTDHVSAGTFGLWLDTQISTLPSTNLDSSDIQAELITYAGMKSSDGALSSDLLALNDLASSDIQAELVTYDAATGTEFATLNNLAASDIAAELATYDAATGTELAALNDLADTDILGYTLETGYTVAQALKLMGSALAGKVSGGGTTTIVFRDLADGANRITATVDSDGNRSAMTLNP